MRYRWSKIVYIFLGHPVFHNLRGYDSHFIIQSIGKIANKHKYVSINGEEQKIDINVIPNNMEKCMAFMLEKRLTVIDSFQFMSTSLDKLVNILPKEAFKYTSEEIKNGEILSLLKRKGNHMDSSEKFDETKLPSKDEFFSILNNEHIRDEDHQHAM